MPASNQRRHSRRPTELSAELAFDWGTLEGVIENVGEGGAFFVTDTLEGTVVVGDRLELEFHDREFGGETRFPGAVLRVDRYFHEGELYRSLAIRFERPLPPRSPEHPTP